MLRKGVYDMKINTAYPGMDGVVDKKRPDGVSGSGAVKFADILNQAAGTQGAESVAPVSGAVPGMEMHGLSREQSAAISSGETALDMLAHLGTLLEGNETAAGSMEAVSASLEEQVNMLLEGRDSLDPSDPLRKTLDEIGMLAAVQGSKISRGDYS
jgi:hypothetical protein